MDLQVSAPPPGAPSPPPHAAVRLPDGRRSQRRFPRAAPLDAIFDFCLTLSEEAAGGRAFTLAQTFPGAPDLMDRGLSLEAAGVADAMLALRWAD